MTTTTKQNMIAVSLACKTFVQDCTADFGGPSKSKPFLAASEREIVDGLVAFVEKTRYVTRQRIKQVEETDAEGNTRLFDCPLGTVEDYEVDTFAEVMDEIIAGRLDTVRTNSASAKLKSAEAELAELRAKLAALMGETVES
jgi:hypothetical protein